MSGKPFGFDGIDPYKQDLFTGLSPEHRRLVTEALDQQRHAPEPDLSQDPRNTGTHTQVSEEQNLPLYDAVKALAAQMHQVDRHLQIISEACRRMHGATEEGKWAVPLEDWRANLRSIQDELFPPMPDTSTVSRDEFNNAMRDITEMVRILHQGQKEIQQGLGEQVEAEEVATNDGGVETVDGVPVLRDTATNHAGMGIDEVAEQDTGEVHKPAPKKKPDIKKKQEKK